jgi:heme-degrading monooxygenase HmoA
MSAFNVVRMRVKPGQEEAYLKHHREAAFDAPGMKTVRVVKTGERDFCIIGEWTSMDALAAARPTMIAMLDGVRDKLKDMGGGLGVTDPISGDVVLERNG